MKIIRKIVLPMLSMLALCFTSCSNDFEQWEYDYEEKDTWEAELRNIVSDFNYLFENSYIKFLGAEELRRKVVTKDFINDDTYYPVFIKNLYNYFMLKDQDFISNDTNNIHMPVVAIEGMVSEIVKNQDKYDFVKLTWLCVDKKFVTVAAFDKSNGQIVYDNILTNIPLSQIGLSTKKSKLTRSEGDGNIETRIFYKDRLTVNANSYYFNYQIKCLCKVLCSQFGNPILLIEYETIEDRLTHPQYSYGMFYPRCDVVIHEGQIIYYLWVGIGEDSFSTYYNSDNPGVNAASFLYDFEHHRWTGYACEAESVGFYSALNNGLYEPYSNGWDF